MAFDVARGMLHLHENGFLHGALKPKNILVGFPVFLKGNSVNAGMCIAGGGGLGKEWSGGGSIDSCCTAV